MKHFLVGAGLLLAMAGMPAAATAQTCTFTLSRTNVVAGPEGPIFGFSAVAASAPTCTWTASTSASWISVSIGGPTQGQGNGGVAYTLQPNTTGANRTA